MKLRESRLMPTSPQPAAITAESAAATALTALIALLAALLIASAPNQQAVAAETQDASQATSGTLVAAQSSALQTASAKAPRNVVYAGDDKWTWDPVDGALGYFVALYKVEDDVDVCVNWESDVQGASWDSSTLTEEPGDYYIGVSAVFDNEGYTSNQTVSKPVHFGAYQLDQPRNVRYAGDYIWQWDAVEHASDYAVTLKRQSEYDPSDPAWDNEDYDGFDVIAGPLATDSGATSWNCLDYIPKQSYSDSSNEEVGNYRVEVVAFADDYLDSLPASSSSHYITSPHDSTWPAEWERLSGATALDTMSKIVEAGDFPKGSTVVLTTAGGYWDALTAAGVAGLTGAPVLMTDGKTLSKQTASQLKKLAPVTIVACGGTAAVSDKVLKDAVAAAGGNAASKRLWGQNAIETAEKIFAGGSALTAGGASWSNTAFICTSNGYWDALSAAPVSYAAHMPIFLTQTDGKITSDTIRSMKKGGIDSAYIVGGTAAIPNSTTKALEAQGVTVKKRLWGATAIETSDAVAEFGLSKGMVADNMGVATGTGYWDALAGAALCGKLGSVLVLVNDNRSVSINDFVHKHEYEISHGYIFGGPAAVSEAASDAIYAATSRRTSFYDPEEVAGSSSGGSESSASISQTYVVNKNSGKIHLLNCVSVHKMKESSKWYAEGYTLEQLEAMGYTRCKNCL